MATLGQKPATTHVSFQKQTITGNGGTSYTLQQSVGSELDIAVFINNTRQEPTTAYTASGTTLVMTGAVNSSDNFYVIFFAKAINTTGLPVSAVNTSSINANAVTMDKLATSGTLPALDGSGLTGISKTGLVHFYGQKASSQTLSRGVGTDITGFTNGEIDSHSAFDGATFTVPAGQGGVYHIAASIEINYGDVGSDGEGQSIRIQNNATTIRESRYFHPSNQGLTNLWQMETAGIFNLSAGNAITINATGADQSGGGGGKILGGSSYYQTSVFYGFRLA
tara:strand:- start:89 stop:928 length:840 start_codon:yes stop_codon:yes gene_type:complete